MIMRISLFAGDEQKLFTLFPIPLKSNTLFVERNKDSKDCMKITQVELRNLIGKRLQSIPFSADLMKVSFDNMDEYPNGIYVVLAFDSYGKIIETSKFIINK